MENKKGFMIELITFVIIGIITVSFFALFIYGFNLINTTLTSGEMDTKNVNLTTASTSTFSYLNTGMSGDGGLKLIAAIMLIGYALSTLIFAWFSSKHQLWLFVYILMTIIIVIFSVYISNAYEGLMSNEVLGEIIADFGIASYIVLKLPIFASVIGLIGIVLCIVGGYIRRDNLQ